MTRSYYDPYANPEFQKGTSEDDIEAYAEMVQEKTKQVEEGIRDSSYVENLKQIEERKLKNAEEEGDFTDNGLKIDFQNMDQEGVPAGFPTDSILDDEPKFDELPGANVPFTGGKTDWNRPFLSEEEQFERDTDPLKSVPSGRTLSEHPRFISDNLDIDISDSERLLVSNLPIRWTPSTDQFNRPALIEAIANINENYPDIAALYGGDDRQIQIEEIIKDSTFQSGKLGHSGSYHNLMAEKYSRRLHALTKKEQWGLRENLVETGNRFNKGQNQLLKAIVSFPEHAFDTLTWQRVRALQGKNAGQWVERSTKELYKPSTIDLLPDAIKNYNPWTQNTKWSGLFEWLGFQWAPAVITGSLAPKGTFAMKGLPIPKNITLGKNINIPLPKTLGLRTNLGGGAVRDAQLFLPGNILQQHNDPIHKGESLYSPHLVDQAMESNQMLYQLKNAVPEINEGAPLYANGILDHPTIYRLGNILAAQTSEVLETYAFLTIGGSLFRPVRTLSNLFDVKIGRPRPGRMLFDMYGGPVAEGKTFTVNEHMFWKRQRAKQVDADMAWSQFAGDDDWIGSDGLLSPNMGAYKLKDSLKQPGQARSLPVGQPAEILNAANTKSIESPLGISGSTEAIFTPLQTKRIIRNGLTENTLEDLSRALVNDRRYSSALKSLSKDQRKLGKLFSHVLERQQKVLGRDASKSSPAEFWGPQILNQEISAKTFDDADSISNWYLNNIVSADNINSAIFTTLRDRAIGAKNIESGADIFSADGPVRNIADNLVVGLTNVRRSRYQWELLGRAGREGKLTKEALQQISATADEAALQFGDDSKAAVEMMMQLVEQRNSDEVANALLEMFSMSNDIHNWTDFDAWMKAKLLGNEFGGKTGDGVLIKELQGVMMNSILSGPKTPMRALMGTTTNMYANAINEAAGALIRSPFTDDIVARRAALAKAKAMFELIPESWTMLKRNISANWSGDVKTIKSRYYTQRGGKSEDSWELFKAYGEVQDNVGLQAAINIGDVSKNLNDSKWTTANIRIMAGIDDTAKWLLARARSREKALRQILDQAGDDFAEITPEVLSKAEDLHYSHLLDAEGNINLSKDSWLKKQFEEVTLTEDIGKLGEALNKVFEVVPLAKPFYLFSRSGINGLKLSFKNTPALSLLMEESRAILRHSGDDFTSLAQYGIENAEDLANARNLFTGRQAVGSAVAMGIFSKYAAGELTGNGPADKQLKQTWINSGWKPNTITLGGIVVDYSSLEPYNLMFSAIADIGDNVQLMGDEWAEKRLQAVGFVIGRGLTGKTYLSGLDQLMQMTQGRNWNKNIANILNNSLPLAGLRNEVGKWLNPHMKELNSSMWASLRNRNQYFEALAHLNPWLNPLVEKADILNGEPIQDWNFIQRSFNMISPVQISIKSKSPGRTLLQQSNYDQKSTVYGYDGYSFTRSATVRSLFQSAMGRAEITVGHRKYKNLEHYLDTLAKDPDIKASIAKMKKDIFNPANWDLDPNVAYNHNKRIDEGFEAARAMAWAAIIDHPEVQKLIQEQDELKRKQLQSSQSTDPLGQRDALLQLGNP